MSDRLPVFAVAGLGIVCLLLGLVLGAAWVGGDQAVSDCKNLAELAAHEASAAKLACKQIVAEERAAKEKRLGRMAAKQKRHSCNVCGSTKKFERFGGRKDAECPVCKTKERHRLLAHYIEHETTLMSQKRDVLHFAPMVGLRSMFSKRSNLHYVTADLYKADADLKLDITAIDVPDASWDVVIAYHVLEHVLEDQKAMRELFRILRPGGQALLQVPLFPGQTEILEDPTITDPKERKRAFGQADHVRLYSADGLRRRLESAGFEVEAIDYLGRLEPETVTRHKLVGKFGKKRDLRIWVARKPDAG